MLAFDDSQIITCATSCDAQLLLLQVPSIRAHLQRRRQHLPQHRRSCRCAAANVAETETTMTQRMFEKMNAAAQTKQGAKHLWQWC